MRAHRLLMLGLAALVVAVLALGEAGGLRSLALHLTPLLLVLVSLLLGHDVGEDLLVRLRDRRKAPVLSRRARSARAPRPLALRPALALLCGDLASRPPPVRISMS